MATLLMGKRPAILGIAMLAVLVSLGALLFSDGPQGTRVAAHDDPVNCTGTGVSLLFEALRDTDDPPDGVGDTVILASGPVVEGETIYYRTTIARDAGANGCAFQEGTITITPPDGVAQ